MEDAKRISIHSLPLFSAERSQPRAVSPSVRNGPNTGQQTMHAAKGHNSNPSGDYTTDRNLVLPRVDSPAR
eukprot:1969937-Prymnesium_polylepis.3